MRISDWSSDVCSSDLPCPSETSSTPRFELNSWCRAGQSLLIDSDDYFTEMRLRLQVAVSLDGPRKREHAVDHRLQLGDPRSEEHTSELQSLMRISYAVFCLKKKTLQK